MLVTVALGGLGACSSADPPKPAVPDAFMGLWLVDLKGNDGITYEGTLDVTQRIDDGRFNYNGTLKIQYLSHANQASGNYSAVIENAWISVEGDHVRVICTEPVVVTEDSDYIPDNFYLTRQGPKLLTGVEKDIEEIGGTVTLTKR